MLYMNKLIIVFFVILLGYSDSHSQRKLNANSTTVYSILFIGNSLTYSNNLSKMVVQQAKQQGITIEIKTVAKPNYAIIDHWNDGQVQKLIASKEYDFVIIQQGPSSQTNGRKMLIEDGKKYSYLCKINDSKLCYFMVWPSLNYYHTFDSVIKNYTDAAKINNAILLRVGTNWKEYIERTNSKKYYGPDGFHPSLEGSQSAANIIVETLFGE